MGSGGGGRGNGKEGGEGRDAVQPGSLGLGRDTCVCGKQEDNHTGSQQELVPTFHALHAFHTFHCKQASKTLLMSGMVG